MALQAIEFHELDLATTAGQPFDEFVLLVHRIQEIRRHADDLNPLGPDRGKSRLHRTAMVGDIEQVACA